VGGHPLAGPKELRRPGRKLSCASCHDPHGSSHVYMLIEEPMEGLLCRVCHNK
jgi:predicted CXXCH cytochrome family protein